MLNQLLAWVEVEAVPPREAQLAAEAASATYDCAAYATVADMVAADVGVDAASVCTAGVENGGDHYEPTMALLNAGIPVLGEKPISNEIQLVIQIS